MAKRGRERLREWGLEANARYVLANAHDAPLKAAGPPTPPSAGTRSIISMTQKKFSPR